MHTVFLIGSIASGKSTAARYLERRGAYRIDLDAMCKSLYVPDSELVVALSQAFGKDILDDVGEVRPHVLASRAFADASATARLEALVYPVLEDRLHELLSDLGQGSDVPLLVIVEVSAPRSFTSAFVLADEVLAITAPYEVRRARACARGMEASDFDARDAVQMSEPELCALATTVIENVGDDDVLFRALDAWLVRSCPALCRGVAFDG
ncbi:MULTISPECIES: dephospho-CoA kinase [Enorma]|uniref:dephospho-CoA kinase n=1 Tax=Enorma TaxID=1472762 RepID=UPI00034B236F|nr:MULTISPECIES: dephospho-CoA kinase [Enorma]